MFSTHTRTQKHMYKTFLNYINFKQYSLTNNPIKKILDKR